MVGGACWEEHGGRCMVGGACGRSVVGGAWWEGHGGRSNEERMEVMVVMHFRLHVHIHNKEQMKLTHN